MNTSENIGYDSYSEFSASETFDEIFDSSFEEKNVSQKTPEQSLEQEYYANLELPYGAGFDEIKKSYKKLLKKYHPDKFYGDEKKLALAQDVVKKLNLAYSYFEEKYRK